MDDSPRIFGIPIEVAFAGFALLVAVNLVFLDIFLVASPEKIDSAASVVIQSNQPATAGRCCPAACLNENSELSTACCRSKSYRNNHSAPTRTPAKTASAVREFFVPFGSGSGMAPTGRMFRDFWLQSIRQITDKPHSHV